MNRIIIIGCPGSGKSYLSLILSEYLNIEVYHLDRLFWNEDRTNVDNDTFDSRLDEILIKDKWIIDGNYSRTLEKRLNKADTVIYLKIPVDVCLSSIEERKGKNRIDMPFNDDILTDGFIDYVKEFSKNNDEYISDLLDKFKGEKIIFNNRDEVNNYIDKLKKNGC